MTDRELLELAAKAAKLLIRWSEKNTCLQRYKSPESVGYGKWVAWNPLTDDGDALRLAVAIERFPEFSHDKRHVFCGYELVKARRSYHAPILEPVEPDIAAATRRAIVRAAAAKAASHNTGEKE